MADILSRTVLLAGLDPEMTSKHVKEILKPAASVENVIVRMGKDKKSTCTAFVTLTTSAMIDDLNSYVTDDANLEVCSMNSRYQAEFEQYMREYEADALFEKLCTLSSPLGKKKMLSRLEQMGVGLETKSDPATHVPLRSVGTDNRNLHANFMLQAPRLPIFSGERNKDSSYGRWKYEVRCLFNNRAYPEQAIMMTVRQSLKGAAADVVTRMGENVSAEDILVKFESIYGTVMAGETILERFYSAKQGVEEDCASWSCRLEELAYQALEKEAIAQDEISTMMRSRFWSGLRDSRLKDALRQKKTSIPIEELVKEARGLEEEFGLTKQVKEIKPKIHQQQTEEPKDKMMNQLQEIMNRLLKLEENISSNGNKSHTLQNSQPEVRVQQPSRGHQGYQRQTRRITCYSCNKEGHVSQGCRQGTNIECFTCKETGHVSRGCRKHLNGQ